MDEDMDPDLRLQADTSNSNTQYFLWIKVCAGNMENLENRRASKFACRSVRSDFQGEHK